PSISEPLTDRLCRLVLLGLLPAVVERNLNDFGEALAELQQLVGRCFASAQGGIYARPELDLIVAELRSQGLQGVGQSSWGPTRPALAWSRRSWHPSTGLAWSRRMAGGSPPRPSPPELATFARRKPISSWRRPIESRSDIRLGTWSPSSRSSPRGTRRVGPRS